MAAQGSVTFASASGALSSTSAVSQLQPKLAIHGLSNAVIIWRPVASFGKKSTYKVPVRQLPNTYRQLHLWRNGFSLDDGALFSYDDPGNEDLLKKLYSGDAPSHFMGVQAGEGVDLELISHKDEDYVEPASKPVRIPGFTSIAEQKHATLFGVGHVSLDAIVQLRPIESQEITSHRGLLVEYTSLINAALAVDTLLETTNSVLEFVRIPVSGGEPDFVGPPPSAPQPGNAPPTPSRYQETELPKDIKDYTKKHKSRSIYWYLVDEAIKQRHAAEAVAGVKTPSKTLQSGDWLCLKCDQYNFRWKGTKDVIKKADPVCYNDKCKADKFTTVYEQLMYDPNKSEDPLPKQMQSNVILLEAPDTVTSTGDWPNLPLQSMFFLEEGSHGVAVPESSGALHA